MAKKKTPSIVKKDKKDNKSQNQSNFQLVKQILSDNIAIITFLQLIFAILAFVYMFFQHQENTTSAYYKDDKVIEEVTEIEEIAEIKDIKEGIKEDVKKINVEFLDNSLKNKKDRLCVESFQSSALHLVAFHGVHDISEFFGNNLEESSDNAIYNIKERIEYDDYIRFTIERMNKVIDLSIIKNDKNYSFFKLVNKRIIDDAQEWLYDDSIRNSFAQTQLRHAKNRNDSSFYRNALNQFKEYKNDPKNYRFQKNFYSHLISINRRFK